jgi:hypothetical protein
MTNPSTAFGNGSVYSNGYAIGQNAALKQNEMNNAIGGRGRRGKRGRINNGGGVVEVQQVHTAYTDPSNGIKGLNNNLTQVTAQNQAYSQYDSNLVKGGTRRRSIKRRKTRKLRPRKTKRRRHM